MPEFDARTHIGAPPGALWAWHASPGAFERLIPPWEHVRVVERTGGLEDGSRLVLALKRGPLRLRWVAEHRDVEPGRCFSDVQLTGPFRAWQHLHRFDPEPEGSLLVDQIAYELPGWPVGPWLFASAARRALERAFAFRHRRTRTDLARHQRYAPDRSLRIAVSGASGFIGSRLCAFLTAGGHQVLRLVRGEPSGADEVRWSVRDGTIDAARLEGLDAVIHLAGSSIAVRWTDANKREILESRERGTRLLAETLAGLERPPAVLVSGSAIGFYGDTGDREVTEATPSGDGFAAEVCRRWEAAADPARAAGIRVVHPRIGVVLEPGGGALDGLLPLFRCGLGGPLGGGGAFVPWVAADDVLGAIYHAVCTPEIAGPMNVVSPNPVRNRELARVLGRVLRRPAILPAPAFAVRLLMGQMGDEVLLWGQRARPVVLEETGYSFAHTELEDCLRFVLGTWRAGGVDTVRTSSTPRPGAP